MAIINLTEDQDQGHVCSAQNTGGIHSQLICLSVINGFLSITAFLGNTLILVALHKESSLHAPSKLLFRTLATTDLFVGVIVQPLTITLWMSAKNEHWNICRYTQTVAFVAGYVLCTVSLLTLTAISLDRLLALLLRLRYRQVVNVKRVYVTVTVLWILAIVFTSMYFINEQIMFLYGKAIIAVCLVTTVFSYVRIFLALRNNRPCVHQAQPRSQTVPLNIARYKKTVSSALWVQLALLVCYLPYAAVLLLKVTASVFLARQYTVTLVYLNSSLNPILYCWKIKEVRQAVKDTMRQLRCSLCS